MNFSAGWAGVVAAAFATLAMPVLIALSVALRGRRITALEIAMYWLGGSGAFILGSIGLMMVPSVVWEWHYNIGIPLAVGSLIGIISTAYLIGRRGLLIGTLELLVYWLGCAIPFVVILALLSTGPGDVLSLRIMIPALAIVTVIAVWAYWRKGRQPA
jgi:hypothetical protein